MMIKFYKHFLLLLGLGLCAVFVGNGHSAYAQSQGIGFTSQAIFEEHQTRDDLPYWWLKVKPGEQINLKMKITNGNQENTFDITVHQAVTNDNFTVDYGLSENEIKKYLIKNNAMIDFYNDVFVGNQNEKGQTKITLSANQSVIVPIKLQIPKTNYNGQTIGGITVTREGKESERKNGILNVYSDAIALVLDTQSSNKSPQLQLGAGTLKTNSQEINLKNPFSQMIQKVTIDATIKDNQGKVYSNLQTAQAAVVPYASVKLQMQSQSPLVKGKKYILTIKGNHQEIEKTLSVDASGKVQILSQKTTSPQGLNLKTILIMTTVGVIILGFLVWKLSLKHRKKQN